MNKAFTREDEESSIEDMLGIMPDHDPLPLGTRNTITLTGFRQLQDELRKLQDEERPQLQQRLAGLSNEQIRASTELLTDARRLIIIERRIRYLSRHVESAEVIDPLKQAGDRVQFGATVVVSDQSGQDKTYVIVGVDEVDTKRGRISWLTPLAQSLTGLKIGQSVMVPRPKGPEELTIQDIRYEAIE